MRPVDMDLPERPGVYVFRNEEGKVIYVGKALSLRNRVRSYFQSAVQDRKTARLQEQIETVDFIVTNNEVEALILELNLIKRYRPRFNVKFIDDKHYPYIRISRGKYPGVSTVRKMKEDRARYFGPYTRGVGPTLKLARSLFPFRTCSDRRLQSSRRACLYHHIRRCPGPCVNDVSPEEYQRTIDELCLFLEGRQSQVLVELKKDMHAAAETLDFERAAVIRDRIKSLDNVFSRQKVVLNRPVDQDVIAVAQVQAISDQSSPVACVQVLQVRDGKLVGESHSFIDGIEDQSSAAIIDAAMKEYYSTAASVPPQILVSVMPTDHELINSWLEERTRRKVTTKVPRRGVGRALMEMAVGNVRLHAQEYVPAADLAEQEAADALQELAGILGLKSPPLRIEGYDTSAISGKHPVASMVVFEQGQPYRSGYRRFALQGKQSTDDLARLKEAVKRRAARLQADDKKFGAKPDLVIVDGGNQQRVIVQQQLKAQDINVPVVAIAKQKEALYVEGYRSALILSKDSPALKLIQRIRDEAHRFAVEYHRHRRSRRSLSSVLDDVPGVGPRRKKALLEKFKTVTAIRAASVKELADVCGIGPQLAEIIYDHLKQY